jgi:hypothetical protein
MTVDGKAETRQVTFLDAIPSYAGLVRKLGGRTIVQSSPLFEITCSISGASATISRKNKRPTRPRFFLSGPEEPGERPRNERKQGISPD